MFNLCWHPWYPLASQLFQTSEKKQSQGEREEGERIGCGALRVNSSSGEARSGWTRLFHYSPSGAGGAGAGTTGGRIDAINANYWWTAVGGGWWEGRVQQHVGGGGREAGQDHVRARGRLHVLRSPAETIFSAGGLLLQAGLGQLKLLAVRVPAILLHLELAVEVRGLDIRAARLVQQKLEVRPSWRPSSRSVQQRRLLDSKPSA